MDRKILLNFQRTWNFLHTVAWLLFVTNPRYCDSNKDGDDGDHDPGHVDVVVADNPGRAQEDVVVEDDEDRDGEDAGGEERVQDLGDDAELDVANLVGDVVLDPANLRNIVL